MKTYIKIPFLLKIYSFLLLVVWFMIIFISWSVAMVFLNDSLRDNISFTTPTVNIVLLVIWIISFSLSFQLLFFKKNLNILHYFILLIWIIFSSIAIIFWIYILVTEWAIGIDLSSIIFLIIFLFIDIFCILCYKKIRSFNGLLKENEKNTIPDLYTTESQSKNIFFWFWIYAVVLSCFYIFYFNRPLDIKNIPDSYFNSDYSYIDKNWKENSFQELVSFINENENISSKNSISDKKVHCILSKSKADCDTYINEVTSRKINEPLPIKQIKDRESGTWKYDISPIIKQDIKDKPFFDEINKLNDELYKKVVLNKYYKNEDISGNNTTFVPLLPYCRLSILSSLYDIQTWQQEIWIAKLVTNYKLWEYLMYWENQSVIWLLVWITITQITLNEMNFIVDNYKLDSPSKKLLSDNLKNEINIDWPYSNALKQEYKYINMNVLQLINLKTPLLFDGSEMNTIRANVYYNNIENKFEELDILEKKIESDFFRKNYVSSQLWIWNWINFKKQYEKLIKLNENRMGILNKLQAN